METMNDLDRSTVEGLQSLCKLCHDSAEGYRTAAEQIDNDTLKQMFIETAQDRESARDRLATMLGTSHEDIPDGGTMLGDIHQWWIEARSSISSNDAEAVLKEAIRGEKTIEDKFENVLKNTSGSPANAMLQERLSEIKTSRKTLETLKEDHAS